MCELSILSICLYIFYKAGSRPENKITMVTDLASVLAPWTTHPEVAAMLLYTTRQWCVTIIPILICVVLVNLFFRHAFSVLWFSFKGLLAVGIYMQVKEVIESSISQDHLGIETGLFGIAAGVLQLSSTKANEILRANALLAIAGVCPMCVPIPKAQEEQPEPPLGVITNDEDLSWMNWVRNT